MNKILENMRIFRLMFGFTQGEISEKLGISHTSYANLERGEAILDLEKIPTIEKALGIEEGTLKTFDKKKYLKNHKIQ
jgi:transcriptional regulator with XRE-family HTH domain